MLRYLAPAGCVPEVVVEVDAVALTAVVAVAVVVVVIIISFYCFLLDMA